MPTFAYLRHTSPFVKQTSVEAQRAAIEAHATALGLSMTMWLEDGREMRDTPLADRPAGGRLCDQLQPADHVLVVSTSLLTPSLRDLQHTMTDWHERGIVLHFQDRAGGWVDTSYTVGGVNAGDALLQVIESEQERHSESIREGILVRRLQGKRHGRYPPLGFQWEGPPGQQQLVPDLEEQTVMRQIVELRNEGWTWERMYFELLKQRVKTRDGREWSVTRIRRAAMAIRAA